MRTGLRILSGILIALGLLWLLQGTGIVHLRPILCVADCDEISGTSAEWAIIGLVATVAGGLLLARTRRSRPTDE